MIRKYSQYILLGLAAGLALGILQLSYIHTIPAVPLTQDQKSKQRSCSLSLTIDGSCSHVTYGEPQSQIMRGFPFQVDDNDIVDNDYLRTLLPFNVAILAAFGGIAGLMIGLLINRRRS